MKTLLITGFAPFGGETINPSWEAVKGLPDTIGDYRVFKREIPVAFGLAGETVLGAAEEIRPNVILCVGQAGGRAAITPERIAINLRSAGIPDNRGSQPRQEPCIDGGPDGIFATAPAEAMAEAIRSAGLSSAVSNTAGTFVCNDLLYALLHHYAGSNTKVGFIHVPFLPEQAKQGVPSMPLSEVITALAAAISAL